MAFVAVPYFIYASNESKSVLARDLGDCRDNYKKLAERVSHSYSCLKNQTSSNLTF